jgi:hypothetical protein
MVCDRGMAIATGKPLADGLSEVAVVLREWQYNGAPQQLHPGDVGWFWRLAAVTVWSAGRGKPGLLEPMAGT